MSAAYYDIQAEQGSTFYFKITLSDEDGKSLNLKGDDVTGTIPITAVPPEFQDRFLITNSDGDTESVAKAYVRMQVRNSVDGIVLPVDPPSTPNTDENFALFGVGGPEFETGYFPIDIQLGDGGGTQEEANILITIDAHFMEGIRYGKPIYGIDLIYAQDMMDHPKKIVYRLMQGRFIVIPNVAR